jgi:hypothetical protein
MRARGRAGADLMLLFLPLQWQMASLPLRDAA